MCQSSTLVMKGNAPWVAEWSYLFRIKKKDNYKMDNVDLKLSWTAEQLTHSHQFAPHPFWVRIWTQIILVA